ncbi:MAG: hypothetical protein HY013_04180 [Candidatus Solibacter usitatus]|nr:hypothetical protein [Candidatus Solibacter usitatus]
MRRAARLVAPLVLFLAFYWPGLTIYFYQDDFGWLNLRHEVETWRDLGPALFAPKAHGNLRPWSENGFFLLLPALFGADPLPFRIVVFLTQCGNLLLLGAIVRRLTGSATAALWTQALWIANSCLAVAACWTSIYNQFQYVFFILLAFWFLLNRRYKAQWIAFLLGFGSLEVNVMYPALAAVYAWLFDRRELRGTLPLFAASGAYAALHFWAAPAPASGPYALHFDAGLLSTGWSYWKLALGPERLAHMVPLPAAAVLAATLVLTVPALGFALRDKTARLGLAWFLTLLAPLLPLRDHVTDYYVTGPAIGLALLGGWAASRWRLAWLPVGLYLAASIPAAWSVTRWHHQRARAVEDLVLGVAEVRRRQPGKVILLSGVNTDLFFSGIVDVPFRALEIPHVYLAPGSGPAIQAAPDLVGKFILPEGLARQKLMEGGAVVYAVSESVLRNVTSRYRALAEANWQPGPPRMVNPGDPIYVTRLGTGWQEARNGYRTMSRLATLRIGGPRTSAERLFVGAFAPAPLDLTVRADGILLGTARLQSADGLSERGFALPAGRVGTEEIDVTLEASQPGLRFGFLEVR